MSVSSDVVEDECEPNPDFTAGPFVTRRDPHPVRELITTFSELYINSEEDNDSEAPLDVPLPPPPLPDVLDPQFSAQSMDEITRRITTLEEDLHDCVQKVSLCCLNAEFNDQCRFLEERLNYKIERECERVKNILDLSIQDLGKSVVDCLKRRDMQIDAKLKSQAPFRSTPIVPPMFTPTLPHHRPSSAQIQRPIPANADSGHISQYRPPVRVEFPQFGSDEENDPISFIEHCEDYLALRPLTDYEILASLTSVLKGTAKDWWLAERRFISTWNQFKQTFLQAFLNDDYETEAAKRLLERKQGPKESIRDFAYHYRALCLRWKKEMTEKEIVQSILRNCNPRLASLLRGTVKEVGELVRIGTQIERDLEEAKKYWSQANADIQKWKTQTERDIHTKSNPSNTRVIQPVHTPAQINLKMVTLPMVIRGRYFQAMIDTGSSLTLMQESCWNQLKHREQLDSSRGQTFQQANGQVLSALGLWRCDGELQQRKFALSLYIMRDADLTVPIILGMDFLMSSGICLDFHKAQYTLPVTERCQKEVFSFNPVHSPNALLSFYLALPIPEESSETRSLIHQLVDNADTSSGLKSRLEQLMKDWPTVCTNEIGHTNIVKHRIITTNEVPIRRKAYRVSTEKQLFIDQEIKGMLDKKIIRPSTSPWAAPIVLVPKKGGGQRFCVDFRGLNSKTFLDAYPMPQIQDILESLHGAGIFSTLDLKSGYWQVEMEPESISKTAFVTSSGLFEFLRLPFGLKNAAASFQRLMELVLKDFRGKSCFVYIDDIVVYSRTEEEHLTHLQAIFHCLYKAGLTINLQKCNLMQKSLMFLGHVVSSDGIQTDPAKVEAVSKFPVPQCLKEVQRFLGLAGWYQRFINRFSEKAAPLHALKRKGATWSWTEECQKSFELIKQDLTNAPVLMAPDLTKSFKVQTDASEVGLGAVLTQELEGAEHVIAYASRLLQGAEKSYSVSEKDCCAVIWAVEKWRPYLEGRPFEIITDHAALTWVFNHPKPSSRLTRWAIRVQEFDFSVKYRKGQCPILSHVVTWMSLHFLY